jgi:hypothetical protein
VLTFWRVDDRILRSRLTDGTDGEPTEWSKAFACKLPPLQATVQCKWLWRRLCAGVRGVLCPSSNTTAAVHDYLTHHA